MCLHDIQTGLSPVSGLTALLFYLLVRGFKLQSTVKLWSGNLSPKETKKNFLNLTHMCVCKPLCFSANRAQKNCRDCKFQNLDYNLSSCANAPAV